MLLVLAVLVLLVLVLAVVSNDLGPGALGLDGFSYSVFLVLEINFETDILVTAL